MAHFTYSYFVNTGEWRHSGRKDMIQFLSDHPEIDPETGTDTRTFEVQAQSLMDDWDSMLGELTSAKPEAAATVD